MGQAKIQEGSFRIIHITELEELQQATEEIDLAVKTYVTEKHPLYPYLSHEISQLKEYLNEIKPKRERRAINFLGTTWKWLAGTPDHDDFVMIKKKINNILENNNRQTIINNLYNDRLNLLSNISNQILETIKDNNILSDQVAFKLQYKIKILKEEIINIKYGIHWAKLGIINSILISKIEIETISKILESEQLPFATAEEALDFSKVKIITNGTCLLYVIEIPLTKIETYNKILIKPIKIQNVINQLEFEQILTNDKEMYGIAIDCNVIRSLTICNKNNIVNLENSACIKRLFESKNSTCNIINNQHIPTIEEIDQGIIFLNQYKGEVFINNEVRNLSGTYLIKFHNTTISIMGKNFTSKETKSIQILPPILQPKSIQKDIYEHLSLELLKEIHINNTKQIELLKQENEWNQTINFWSISVIIIILTIIIISVLVKKRRTIKINNISKNETTKPVGNPETAMHPQIILRLQPETSNEDI